MKYTLTVAMVLLAAFAAAAQVEERNVRAEMGFLASDAMQGRGSGSLFEHVAAEYIGSQFAQFGLEPAGENDADGKQTYVQTVEVPGRSVLSDITFTAGGNTFTKGKDFAILSLGAKDIAGELQKLSSGGTAKQGAIVLLDLGDEATFETIQSEAGKLTRAGAAAVLVIETKEIREHWGDIAGQPVSQGRRGSLIAVSKETAAKLVTITPDAKCELHAAFVDGPKTYTWNAMGKITGSDAKLGAEIILLTSHLDHLGVRANNSGSDKIFNGADDDASGTTAVLELARVLGSGKKPKRTVYFICFGSEESGGFGARYFLNNMPFAKEKLVANLEFEMIGRPDEKVKPDELWLTGYERTNLGPELAKRGAKIVADPHPDQNFFQRSDNIQLARAGIVAQTVSSFGLHKDYHQASDEIKTIDFAHMTHAINSMVEPVKWLVNTDWKPSWNDGKKP